MRSMTFGSHGEGLMVYVILEDQRRVFQLKVMVSSGQNLSDG
jgi:hypothetical protein